MLDRILLPVDGSEIFSETLGYIRLLGNASAPEVTLLHVQDPAKGQPQNDTDAAGHPLLKGYYDSLHHDGWTVRAELRTGNPVDEITRYAVQTEPELLVMSTHGRSGLENIRQGSTTEQVVRQSPCPVFILHSSRADSREPGGEHLFHRILVPLDGTEVSAAILPCVQHFARRFNTEVVLFHDHPDCEEPAEASKRREFIDRHGVELANAGITVQLDCSTLRQPIQEILRRTDDLNIDLIAMVSHGQGGEPRALDESVTANIMRHASRPLLVWSSDPQCPAVG
ncbi:MAG: universal stress protein [Gammaproteobacteria bacterium]